MKALLIIDMQQGCFKPYSLKYKTLDIVKNINVLSSRFRELGYLVIHIAHDGTRENYLYPGTNDFKFLVELEQKNTDKYIVKEANDAFYKTKLNNLLINNKITDLYICGQATNFCLDATIKIALNKEYRIFIPSDAHTTSSAPNIESDILIDYYNWLWSNLTPTKYSITVDPCSSILQNLG